MGILASLGEKGLKDFGVWKKKTNFADVIIWRGFDVICVCPLDHGQQPMKTHTEVMLLYK